MIFKNLLYQPFSIIRFLIFVAIAMFFIGVIQNEKGSAGPGMGFLFLGTPVVIFGIMALMEFYMLVWGWFRKAKSKLKEEVHAIEQGTVGADRKNGLHIPHLSRYLFVLFSYKGRINGYEYAVGIEFIFFISVFLSILSFIGIPLQLFLLVVIWMSCVLLLKRFHDLGWSGKKLLISVFLFLFLLSLLRDFLRGTSFSWIWEIFNYCFPYLILVAPWFLRNKKGDPTDNQFGSAVKDDAQKIMGPIRIFLDWASQSRIQ